MRRYRKQRRRGLRSVRILLDETDIDALIRMRLPDCESNGPSFRKRQPVTR